MAFDEIALPLRVGFGSKGGPNFSTEIIVIENGFERRNQNWAQARRVYDARVGVRSAADAAALLAFFHARAGRARGFRVRDWSDYSSAADNVSAPSFADQIIGIGDGLTVSFRLAKTYGNGGGAHTRLIFKPVEGSVRIGIDGADGEDGWSVNTVTGEVTFATPPAEGQTITAGFLFDVPVRFDTDYLPLTADTHATYEAEIPLVELRV